MRPSLTIEQIKEIQKLKEDGVSLYKIAKDTHHSYYTIKDALDTSTDMSVNEEINDGSVDENKLMPNSIPKKLPQQQKENSFSVDFKSDKEIKSTPEMQVQVSPIKYANPEIEPIKPEEAIIEVKGIPIGKKIQFTPKNLTMWEWFKTRYQGWENSDLSDFINQCMDYFFRTGLGAKMKIEVVQEYA